MIILSIGLLDSGKKPFIGLPVDFVGGIVAVVIIVDMEGAGVLFLYSPLVSSIVML